MGKNRSTMDRRYYKHIKHLDAKVVFEFGSYDLADGIRYRELWPKARMYCFEPDPRAYKSIVNVAKNFNINLFNCAISNVNKVVTFYPTCIHGSGRGPSGSILKHTSYHQEIQEQFQQFLDPIKVQAITIKDFCKEHKIENIDFMHVDVEGATIEVIDGFGDIRPKMMRMEVIGRDVLFENAPTEKQATDLLLQKGYHIKFKPKNSMTDILYEYGN